jgi:uncharacterized protein (TIGR02145 family)
MRLTIVIASTVLILNAIFIGCSGYGSEYTPEEYSSDSFSFLYSSSYKGGSSSSTYSSAYNSSYYSSSSETLFIPDLEYDKNLNATVKLDSVWYKGSYAKTIQIGSYIWLAENAKEYPTWRTSKCYDVKDENCEKYGYLYLQWDAATLCPDDFSIATASAWESLFKNVSSNKYVISSTLWSGTANGTYALNLVPGGMCDGFTCTDGGKKAYYVGAGESKSDTKIYVIDSDSHTSKPLSSFSDSSFFSVRCAKLSTQVKKGSDLSACDTKEKIMVQEDSSTYTCIYGKWFKEVYREPECSKSTEGSTYYKIRPYVCQDGEWRELEELEIRLGYCTSATQNATAFYNDTSYICDSLSWRKQTLLDAQGECNEQKGGDSIYHNGISYVCRNSMWQTLSSMENKYGVCNPKRLGEVIVEQGDHYICKNNTWSRTTAAVDVYGKCDTTKTDSIYVVSNHGYVCEGGAWRGISNHETLYGLCNAKKQDTLITLGNYKIICDNKAWRYATLQEAYGACTAELQDTIYIYATDTNTYVCDNLTWSKLTKPNVSLSYCTKKNQGSKAKTTTPKAFWYCNNYQWTRIDSLSYNYGICSGDSVGNKIYPKKDSLGYICKSTGAGLYQWVQMTIKEQFNLDCDETTQDTMVVGRICDNGDWRVTTSIEKTIGKYCSKKNLGEKVIASSKYYECESTGWTSITQSMYYLGECSRDSLISVLDGVEYYCSDGKWITPPNAINDTTKSCSGQSGKTGAYKGKIYICKYNSGYYNWVRLNDAAIKLGFCTNAREGELAKLNDKYYMCQYSWWRVPDLSLILSKSECGTINIDGQEYTCSGDKWTPVYGSMTDSDKNTYKTLKVGTQTWMVENLNYKTENSWCYNNADRYCAQYGRLYTWDAAQTACPKGWHLPSHEEFNLLRSNSLHIYLSNHDNGNWQTQNANIKYQAPGFEFLAAGIRTDEGSFDYEHRLAGMWLTDTLGNDANKACFMKFMDESMPGDYTLENSCGSKTEGYNSLPESPDVFSNKKGYGYSVRCVKDN